MIKRNDESDTQPGKRNIQSFKKFSEFSVEDTGGSRNILPQEEYDRPANPNVPKQGGRFEKPMSTNYMMPSGQTVDGDDEDGDDDNQETPLTTPQTKSPEFPSSEKTNEVKFIGKIAKLPKGTKASKGFNFLENVKVSKSSIWYIMVEKQDNELQMVKYNHMKGVDLSKFVNELKTYYKSKYSNSPKIIKMVESISVDGNDKFSCIKNIPLVEIDGKKMISKITEDLIKLLSK